MSIVHMADKVRADGEVSALCYARPRPINMDRASWTFTRRFVTCRACQERWDAANAQLRAALEDKL